MPEIDFNKALSRAIRSGNQLKDYFPPYSHTETKLDKAKENNDVYKTLEFMAYWSKKYASQMSKIAPLLKGKTIENTVDNIYFFLYSNFQYKLDKEKQYLYSPAAAYYFRSTGFDCKSFSIQASCILQILQIPHSFRMIKQPGLRSNLNPNEWLINPDHWTHVYVVVKSGNKELVIDATKHENTESKYLAKHDYKMEHLGLNGTYAPAKKNKQVYGLGCACQGTPAQTTGLGNPNTMALAVANFHLFLDELERQGVSRTITNRMLGLVRYNVERGVDPNLSEIFIKASQTTGQLGNTIGDTLSNISIGGNSAGSIIGAATGNPVAIAGIAQNVISKIGITKFIGSTFGAVFANGLNISCWGASLTPATATERLKKYYQPHFIKLAQDIDAAISPADKQAAINKYLYDVYQIQWYYKFRKINQADWSSCAKNAITGVYQKFFDPLKVNADKIVADLKNQGASVSLKENVVATYIIPKSSTGLADYKAGTEQKVAYGIPQVNITSLQVKTPVNYNAVNNGDGTVTISANGETQTVSIEEFEAATGTKAPAIGSTASNDPKSTSSSLTPILITAALGIGAKMLFFS